MTALDEMTSVVVLRQLAQAIEDRAVMHVQLDLNKGCPSDVRLCWSGAGPGYHELRRGVERVVGARWDELAREAIQEADALVERRRRALTELTDTPQTDTRSAQIDPQSPHED